MRTVLTNHKLLEAWWKQSQDYAKNSGGAMEFKEENIYAGSHNHSYYRPELIARIEHIGQERIILVTRNKLNWQSKTKRFDIIRFLENKVENNPHIKYFIVDNLEPKIKEHHLKNAEYMEKDAQRALNRIYKGRDYTTDYIRGEHIVSQYLDYIKIFELGINTDKIHVQRVVCKLTVV